MAFRDIKNLNLYNPPVGVCRGKNLISSPSLHPQSNICFKNIYFNYVLDNSSKLLIYFFTHPKIFRNGDGPLLTIITHGRYMIFDQALVRML